MDNGQPQTQRPNLLKLGAILAALIIVLVVAFFAWQSRHKSSTGQSALPAGWSHYSNQEIGFQFDYPTAWGNPSVVDDSTIKQPAQGPRITKQTGKRYDISFSNMTAARQPDAVVTIVFTSTDYSSTSCIGSTNCGQAYAFTSSAIKLNLEHNKNLWKHDDSSFSNLNYHGAAGVLTINQMVNLVKPKIDAARLIYQVIQAPSNCVANQLAAKGNCITEENYNDLNRVAKSIKTI